jgi:hypothetical protein
LILLAVVMELGLQRVPNSYSVKRRALEAQSSDLEVLVLGASEALTGVRPDLFERPTYNLSDRSQSLYYEAQFVERYLPSLPKLKLVIFTFSYYAFESSLADPNGEYWRQFLYERFVGFAPEGKVDPLDVRRYSLFFLYTPRVAVGFALHGFKANGAGDIDSHGYEPGTVVSRRTMTEEMGRENVRTHHLRMRAEYLPRNVALMEQAIDRLRARNVEVALVVAPVPATVSKAVDPAKRAEMISILTRLATREGVSYHDYFEDTRFNPDDFADPDHLADPGARKFTKILQDDVVSRLNDGRVHPLSVDPR